MKTQRTKLSIIIQDWITETGFALEDYRGELSDIIDELKNKETREKLMKELKDIDEDFKEQLEDDGKCPECGAELEYEHERFDYCVLDGQRYDTESIGYHYCAVCGWREE